MTTIPGISGNWRRVDSRHGMNLYESVEYGRNIPMLVVDDFGNLIKETRGPLSVAMGNRHEHRSVFASSNRRSKGPVVSGNSRRGFLASRNPVGVDITVLANDLLEYAELEHYMLADEYGRDHDAALRDIMSMLRSGPERRQTLMDFEQELLNDEAIDTDLALSIYNRLREIERRGGFE